MRRFTDRFQDIADAKQNWSWFFALGLLQLLLGIGVIYSSFDPTIFSLMLMGFFLCGAGIIQIIQAVLAQQWKGLFLFLLLGVLYIVAGFLLLVRPAVASVNLPFWIATLCFIIGFFRMLAALLIRFENWGWIFFNGLVTFCLGLMIYADWPLSGLWVIGLFVGVDMILSGWSWILLSLGARAKV